MATPVAERAAAASDVDHVLTREEALALLDRKARRYLHMSGEAFVKAWQAGAFDANPDRPEVLRVAGLLPLIEQPAA